MIQASYAIVPDFFNGLLGRGPAFAFAFASSVTSPSLFLGTKRSTSEALPWRRHLIAVNVQDPFDEASPGQQEGRLEATLERLSDEDASAVAARIWRLYYGLLETSR
jgi:hypothetical protein